MTQTLARIKQAGKNFEIMVDMDAALEFKKGQSSTTDFLNVDTIFTDSKKGNVASTSDLESSFNSTDINEIAKRIVKNGEVLVNQEHRSEEKEKQYRQPSYP